jgi:hypothetical protein
MWQLVGDDVWAALQLQQVQEQRAAISTSARSDPNAGVETQAPKSKSRGSGTKNPALKRVLRGYGKVPKLPLIPVHPRPGAKSNTQPGKPEPVGAATTPALSSQKSAPVPTRNPTTPGAIVSVPALGPGTDLSQPSTRNRAISPKSMNYRSGSSRNTKKSNDQRPNGRQA